MFSKQANRTKQQHSSQLFIMKKYIEKYMA